jgi:uncharacterized protein
MLCPIVPADLDALLALNNAHAVETSWLDRSKLARMIGAAFYARTNATASALSIAFDQDATYDSLNFKWFRERIPRFVYLDRIIVAKEHRGKGVARALYTELFAAARAAGHTLVALEVNRVPPNPASDALHAALGFAEFGRGSPQPGKVVRYLTKGIG